MSGPNHKFESFTPMDDTGDMIHVDALILNAWEKDESIPILASQDETIWAVLVAYWTQTPFRFQYMSGSQPGKIREVVPKVVFTKRSFFGIHYFSGHCPERQADRVFRIDRIQRIDPVPFQEFSTQDGKVTYYAPTKSSLASSGPPKWDIISHGKIFP